jgi:hypothetical protein
MAKKRPGANLPSPEQEAGNQNKVAVSGPNTALSFRGVHGKSLELSYWDLWFCLVAVKMHDGDLDRLAKRIKEEKGLFYNREWIERKRWHLRDLQARLESAGITPVEVVRVAGDLAKTEMRRALKKVMDSCGRPNEWSEPMRNSPRTRRHAHALRGFWDRFPVSPRLHEKKIAGHFRSRDYYPESMSFRIARTLDGYADQAKELLEAGKAAEALALLRGWMTVIIELMEKADDSCGSLGMSFGEGFAVYLKMPVHLTGIEEAVFFPDLLDFLIWEDYGLTYRQLDGYFGGLNEAQADICINHLRHEVVALLDDDLDYQSEEALTLLGRVIAEQRRFDDFEDIALQMGSREWQRIIVLVDRAVRSRKKSLAIKVFEAALTKGSHLDFLTKKFEQLKAGKWDPDPRK